MASRGKIEIKQRTETRDNLKPDDRKRSREIIDVANNYERSILLIPVIPSPEIKPPVSSTMLL